MLRELLSVNPRSLKSNPRKGGKRKHKVSRRKSNPRLKLPNLGDITSTVMPAAIGGAGALGLDIALGAMTFIPPDWKVGWKRTALRAGAAFGIGFLARTVLPGRWKRLADQATAGAMTIVAYDAIKNVVQQQFPQLTLGDYDGDLAAYVPGTAYDSLPALQSARNGGGVGAYVSADGLHGMIPAVR